MIEETQLYFAAVGLLLIVLLLGWFTGWIEDEDRRHKRERSEDEPDREKKS